MSKFGSSQPVRRLEDTRFVTGHGRYIDDTAPEGALRCYVLRSPMAHGRITTLDVSEAREAPGVALVLTGADIVRAWAEERDEGLYRRQPGRHKGAAPVRPILADTTCATWGSRGLRRGRDAGRGAGRRRADRVRRR
jgi:carbon-monoxide dehydrogenase large subunit